MRGAPQRELLDICDVYEVCAGACSLAASQCRRQSPDAPTQRLSICLNDHRVTSFGFAPFLAASLAGGFAGCPFGDSPFFLTAFEEDASGFSAAAGADASGIAFSCAAGSLDGALAGAGAAAVSGCAAADAAGAVAGAAAAATAAGAAAAAAGAAAAAAAGGLAAGPVKDERRARAASVEADLESSGAGAPAAAGGAAASAGTGFPATVVASIGW